MPLTAKGEEIKSALEKEYGAKKGERVLYAGKNKGTFTGIDADINRSSYWNDVLKNKRRELSKAAKGSAKERELQIEIEDLKKKLDRINKPDAESKVPEGRKKLEIKKTPMRPEDEAYLKRMIEEKKVKPEDRKPYTGPKYSPDSATMTRIADAINNLQQRFDAMCSRNDADEKYWSYKPSSRTPSVSDLPKGSFKGTQEEFSTLTPGMRREIERSAAKQRA